MQRFLFIFYQTTAQPVNSGLVCFVVCQLNLANCCCLVLVKHHQSMMWVRAGYILSLKGVACQHVAVLCVYLLGCSIAILIIVFVLFPRTQQALFMTAKGKRYKSTTDQHCLHHEVTFCLYCAIFNCLYF